MPKNLLKSAAETAMNALKFFEERLTPGAVFLKSFSRSLQWDDYSCGAQCAFMILAYYGRARSLRNVMRDAGTNDDGTGQDQLRALFANRGLRPRRISRPTIAKIRRAIAQGFPVLVGVDEDHWAAVYGYAPGFVLVADPAADRSRFCRQSVRAFQERWDKWAMRIEK
ncbi:MAG: hypothetical protein HY360_07175 [Verrucomicrobia bacterium]|nr:hypothetical protein [Verrucomicrobiota bacterium]